MLKIANCQENEKLYYRLLKLGQVMKLFNNSVKN